MELAISSRQKWALKHGSGVLALKPQEGGVGAGTHNSTMIQLGFNPRPDSSAQAASSLA